MTETPYPAGQSETLAEAPGLRVRILTLSAGQCVPWHYHNQITDRFFCMRGAMRVSTRGPEATHLLHPGDTLTVAPGIAHLVEAAGPSGCRYLIVQGVGEYDFVPLGERADRGSRRPTR